MTYTEWLASLQPGDRVIVKVSSRVDAAVKIARVTATQIITMSGDRFSRTTGLRRGDGDSYRAAFLYQLTPEIEQRLTTRRLAEVLNRVNWHTVSLDVLQRVMDVMKEGGYDL